MRGKQVYLAGPIAGLSYDGAVSWREAARQRLADAGLEAFSPLRGKEYLQHVEKFTSACHLEGAINTLSLPRSIMARDANDCLTCDLLLVNLEGAERVSMGTVMEIAWAYARRTPIVCVMTEGNVHEHAMINEAIDFRVNTLDDAIRIAIAVLAPGGK